MNSRCYEEQPTGSTGTRMLASMATTRDTTDRQASIILTCLVALHLTLGLDFWILSGTVLALCGLVGVDIVVDIVDNFFWFQLKLLIFKKS